LATMGGTAGVSADPAMVEKTPIAAAKHESSNSFIRQA